MSNDKAPEYSAQPKICSILREKEKIIPLVKQTNLATKITHKPLHSASVDSGQLDNPNTILNVTP